jgi:hypothetical protein
VRIAPYAVGGIITFASFIVMGTPQWGAPPTVILKQPRQRQRQQPAMFRPIYCARG